MDYGLGDIVEMKKQHPCGTNRWEITRMGADIKIKCLKCDNNIMMPRRDFNKKIKKIIRSALPVSILGIGEPLVYTVTLPLIRPFFTACIGAGAGGALAALFNLSTIKPSILGFFGFLTVSKGTHFFFITAMLGACMGGFILTYFFGINEKRINEVYGN